MLWKRWKFSGLRCYHFGLHPLSILTLQRERERYGETEELHRRLLFCLHKLHCRNWPYTAHMLHPCTLLRGVGQADDTPGKHRVLSAVSLFCLASCHLSLRTTINEPTGSGHRYLSDKIMTPYWHYIFLWFNPVLLTIAVWLPLLPLQCHTFAYLDTELLLVILFYLLLVFHC